MGLEHQYLYSQTTARSAARPLVDDTLGLPLRALDGARRPVRSADQEREALPVTSTKKGRCRLHGGASGSGGPNGKRNGQYRHGERTKAAIAERQKFSALLKMLLKSKGAWLCSPPLWPLSRSPGAR